MSDRITWSPSFNPLTTSIVLTELRPSATCTSVASCPSALSLNSPTVCWPCPNAGRPTYKTLSRRSNSIVPSTLRSGRAEAGNSPVSVTSTTNVPSRAAGSIRCTSPWMIPLRVSTATGCPSRTSLICVSAIFSSAFKDAGSATRAMFSPGVTCCPTCTDTCCNTPLVPARTCNASTCSCFNFANACNCATRACCAFNCAFVDFVLTANRCCSTFNRFANSCTFIREIFSNSSGTSPCRPSTSSVSSCSFAWLYSPLMLAIADCCVIASLSKRVRKLSASACAAFT